MPRSPSLWWDLAGPAPPRPSLHGPLEADVAIVGGGYTGLWTAYWLLRADPGLAVVVLEAEHVGFGASGRNGGWLMGELADGTPVPGALADAEAAIAQEGIECDLVRGGSLVAAQSPAQLARLPREGRLDAAGVAARVRVHGALGGAYTPHCARIQPVRLVLGLAAAVERRGGRILERARATAIEPGRVRTAAGDVRARWVVRATEGFTARGLAARPSLRRVLLPMNSAMIATEPLPADVWAQLGWEGCETLLDGAHRYCYLQRTADGRVAIGGRGRPYRYASRTDRAGEVAPETVDELRDRLAALFPVLRGAPVARAWAGVLGVPRDWRPFVHADPATGLAAAGGYAGEGVTAAFLAGRTLADLLTGAESERIRLAWVGRTPPRWEPEPLRWLGVQLVFGLYRRADAAERRTGRASAWGRVAGRLSGRAGSLTAPAAPDAAAAPSRTPPSPPPARSPR